MIKPQLTKLIAWKKITHENKIQKWIMKKIKTMYYTGKSTCKMYEI